MTSIAVKNKRRGKHFEKKIVQIFKDANIEAKRAWGSDGRSLGFPEYVDIVIGEKDGIETIQCKRVKRLPKKWQIKEGLSMVITQADNAKPMVIMPLQDFVILRRQTIGT